MQLYLLVFIYCGGGAKTMMDRELGFDFYTFKLLLLLVLTFVACFYMMSGALGIYEMIHHEFLADISGFEKFVMQCSFAYFGFYGAIKLIGKTGLASIAETADKAANGDANKFEEFVESDFSFDDFPRL